MLLRKAGWIEAKKLKQAEAAEILGVTRSILRSNRGRALSSPDRPSPARPFKRERAGLLYSLVFLSGVRHLQGNSISQNRLKPISICPKDTDRSFGS